MCVDSDYTILKTKTSHKLSTEWYTMVGRRERFYLVGVVNLVVLEDMELDLLLGVLDLLWLGVGLLLALLTSSTETEDKVKGGLLLDVVVLESAAILELLARKDETLLVRWDPLFILDFGLNSLNGVGAFNLEGNGLAGEGLDEDLHCVSAKQTKGQHGSTIATIARDGSDCGTIKHSRHMFATRPA